MRYVVIALGVVALGLLLPVKHQAIRERTYRATPAQLFALISDVERFPEWRKSVKRVEMLPPVDGQLHYREVGSDGSILFAHVSEIPGRQLVGRIADPTLPFGGGWTFDMIPGSAAGTTTLRITENGEVYNPVFRFVSRFVMGHTATIDRYLGDVATRFPAVGVATSPGA
jgi:hypothetical protein